MSDGWMPGADRKPTTKVYRGDFLLLAVVLHIAQGTARGSIPWLQTTSPSSSAHFFVDKAGHITQFASIRDRTWANGLRWVGNQAIDPEGMPVSPSWVRLTPGMDPNKVTVSVEHEGFWWERWTAPMYQANLDVLQYIAQESGLVYQPHSTLIGHNEISPHSRTNCPGPNCDLTAIATAANAHHAAQQPDASAGSYVVKLGPALVRMQPSRLSNPPLRSIPVGERVQVLYSTSDGQPYQGNAVWRFLASGGWIWSGLLEKA
jgi:N-acetyl-anhydromuramyl-L-alanine amidase AmpD